MRHPSEATLALHAGGDLGAIGRWRTERHLAKCGQCREEVAAFSATREIATELAELPRDLNWNRLAAEMKANIRLGLAAGECVRTGQSAPDSRWFTGARAAVAFASVVLLLLTGVFLERPQPQITHAEGTVVEKTANGIQISDGDQALGLMNRGAENVIYTVSAQGNMGARYVDPKTGYVTINNVYAQ